MTELNRVQRSEMQRAVSGLKSISDKIRSLDRAGYSRSDIARFLERRYQHVRNVLVQDEKKKADNAAEREAEQLPRQEWAQIGPDGRVVIPAAYRRLLGTEGGGSVLMLLEDGEVRLVGRDAAVRRAQNLVARYIPGGAHLADELIEERRAEAAHERS